MKRARVLVVDDEPGIRQSLCGVLEDEGYQAAAADSGEACLEELARQAYDLVLLDVWLPGMDGLEALARIQEIPFEDRPVAVMISGHGTIETAVRSTKLGAFDFLEKPLTIPKVSIVVKNALQHRRLELENQRLRDVGESRYRIIGESVPMKALRQQLRLMAGTNGRVLIYGESGTGKELVAHAIHATSQRANEAFVEVNCAAIPEELIESELFGHERGAFTGALRRKIGRFELADEGTLFLDEIGSMSPRTQAKLLRALQDQEFERVGGERTLKVDVRVVAATNRDLLQAIDRGEFRDDLFHRLSVVNIRIPALRQRKADILPLAALFLKKYAVEMHRNIQGFTDEAKALLLEHPWPGNVRELKNAMERTVLMSEREWITPGEISLFEVRAPAAESGASPERIPESMDLERLEREAVLQALERANWVQKEAAAALGISSRVMNYKVKKYNFKNPRWNRNKPTADQN